jgi:protein-S-isoprenylcysteine O-methyltransferase Ste14
MERGEWIAAIAVIVSVLIGLPSLLLQWLTYRASQPNRRPRKQIAVKNVAWRVPRPILLIGNFLIQTAAIYLLNLEYSNSEPPTRQSEIWIASLTGLCVVCFLIPIMLGVYRLIENLRPND